MRILHLFANYKWTGPADPAIRCAAHLRQQGCDVVFAQAEWTLPEAEHRMAKELVRARMPVIGGLELRKHFHVASHLRDAMQLRGRFDRGEFDVVHAHMLSDHLIAAIGKRRAHRRPILVRSYYDPKAPARSSWRDRVALRYTDGVVVPTREVEQQMRRRFGLSADRVHYQDPPIDGARALRAGDMRARWGLDEDEFVIGITARIQRHRRFELLWDAMRVVVDARPNARLVLLGRGNAEDTEQLVREPVERLGLTANVLLPGYLYEPDYSDALRTLDAFVFLVPGSDGTCRAVREAMALGLPVVATRRGILPELLGPGPDHGPGGVTCEESAGSLGAALIALCDDADRRRELGGAGIARARHSMDPTLAARSLIAFYRALRSRRGDVR